MKAAIANTLRGRLDTRRANAIGIVTAIVDEWGGCEELWSKSVTHLQAQGYEVVVYKAVVHEAHPRIAAHKREGVEFIELCPRRSRFEQLWRKVSIKLNGLFNPALLPLLASDPYYAFFRALSHGVRPRLVLISQGINFDGMAYAYACKLLKIPYAIVSHKAVDFYWPSPLQRELFRTLYRHARANYFVSQHNKRLTEEQFAIRLDNARVVFNPVESTHYVDYPTLGDEVRLCCVGRLFIGDKGQDMLLRILSKPKWKSRSVSVTFIGAGKDEEALRDLAAFFDVVQISFEGYCDDMVQVWRRHHALVLPSRCEGLPLTIVEAMFAGRPVITTHVGGNAEFLEDGKTGFIGYAHEESFEEAMERAWNRRHEWEEMGRVAAAEIAEIVPESPEKVFVNMLTNQLCN